MKIKLFLTIALIAVMTTSFAQQNSTWAKWSWLMGEWKGEGSGQPGQGGGIFTFKPELNDKILVRTSHSEYPASGNRPATIHDDLLYVYLDQSGIASKAIYFDNEGHTINYSVSYPDQSIVLQSDPIPGGPIFRLTYSLLENQTINTKFEMSQDGVKFMTYIEGKSKRVK
ncbi:MAG TPA: hypothetical protein VGK10_06225 [Prolixibacteraceae bacterium]|jgi:hypothetical protein